MPGYDDTKFHPPAPVAEVTVRNPDNTVAVDGVRMLIDSGADVTLIPGSVLEPLNLVPGSEESYELMSFDGRRSLTQAVRVDLIFRRKTFKGRFLLIQQEYGILGRDVMNHLALVFDGPKLFWEEK